MDLAAIDLSVNRYGDHVDSSAIETVSGSRVTRGKRGALKGTVLDVP